jgi:hypothetical protein
MWSIARLLIVACLSLPLAPSLAAADQAAKECIVDSGSGFGEVNGKANFKVNLANGCDRKIACRVEVYVTGARGPASGHTTLILAPNTHPSAKLSYLFHVKSAGGTAQYERKCRFL